MMLYRTEKVMRQQTLQVNQFATLMDEPSQLNLALCKIQQVFGQSSDIFTLDVDRTYPTPLHQSDWTTIEKCKGRTNLLCSGLYPTEQSSSIILPKAVEENQKMYSVVIAFDIQLQHQHYDFDKRHTYIHGRKGQRNLIESCSADIKSQRKEEEGGKGGKEGENQKERDGALGKDQSLVPGELRQMK
ncbi:Hypothetical predicted protein [Scomber scombrus]|uniref:Uncharacterized protein n=1 Tax=Scomber scombrus TaxID=13677 RepID=A0AAV1NWS5_SCOSC